MATCEAPVDISFIETKLAETISDAIASTNSGLFREHIQPRLYEYLVAELCTEEGKSIFEPDALRIGIAG